MWADEIDNVCSEDESKDLACTLGRALGHKRTIPEMLPDEVADFRTIDKQDQRVNVWFRIGMHFVYRTVDFNILDRSTDR